MKAYRSSKDKSDQVISNLDAECSRLQKKLEDNHHHIKHLEKDCQQQQSTLLQSEQDLHRTRQREKQYVEDIESLNVSVESLQQEKRALCKELVNVRESLAAEVSEKEVENQELQAELDEVATKCRRLNWQLEAQTTAATAEIGMSLHKKNYHQDQFTLSPHRQHDEQKSPRPTVAHNNRRLTTAYANANQNEEMSPRPTVAHGNSQHTTASANQRSAYS